MENGKSCDVVVRRKIRRAQPSGDYVEPPNDAGTMALPIIKISGLPSKGWTNRAADGLLGCSESLFREVWRGRFGGVDLWCCGVTTGVCLRLDLICERFGRGARAGLRLGAIMEGRREEGGFEEGSAERAGRIMKGSTCQVEDERGLWTGIV
jgi:hypothetical protein